MKKIFITHAEQVQWLQVALEEVRGGRSKGKK